LKFVLALASEAPPVAFEPAQNAEALEAARSRLLDAAIERKVREGSPKTVVAGGVETPGPTPREMPRAVVSLPFWDEAPGRAPAVKFIMPLEGRISSKFGYRQAPMGGARRYHRGVDIAAPNGSPIKAMADGVVAKVSTSYAKGLNVEIQHAAGFSTAYFHLSKSMVKAGQRVRQGEVIAQEGSSGNSTGPHLHFEIHKNGEPVNPALYLRELN
jgi:murein DD-endopeptidase MepM/ murein hydrolase activator NlpD